MSDSSADETVWRTTDFRDELPEDVPIHDDGREVVSSRYRLEVLGFYSTSGWRQLAGYEYDDYVGAKERATTFQRWIDRQTDDHERLVRIVQDVTVRHVIEELS